MAETLADAVEQALGEQGAELLMNPPRFLSFVLDLYSADEAERNLLARNVDEELLRPFTLLSASTQAGPDDLQVAAQEASRILIEERLISEDHAYGIAGQLMIGIGRHLGIIPTPRKQVLTDGEEMSPTVTGQVGQSEIAHQEDLPHAGDIPGQNKLPSKLALLALGVGIAAVVATVLLVVVFPQFRRTVILRDVDGTKNVTMRIEGWQGGTVVMPEPPVEHEGYVFLGWHPEVASETSASVGVGEEVPIDSCGYYHATWNPQVAYDGNGADSGSMETVDVVGNREFEIPSPEYTREGYVFSGWRDKDDEDGFIHKPGEKVIVSKPTTFLAVWSPQVVIDEISIKDLDGVSGKIEDWDPTMGCVALLVKNNSGKTLNLSCEASTLGKSDSKVEETSYDFNYVASGDAVLFAGPLFKTKKAQSASYSIAVEESGGWGAPLAGSVTEKIERQEEDELVLELSNASDKKAQIFSVGMIARDKSSNSYVGRTFDSVELKGGESCEVTFDDSALLGPIAAGPDWRELDCTFYLIGWMDAK